MYTMVGRSLGTSCRTPSWVSGARAYSPLYFGFAVWSWEGHLTSLGLSLLYLAKGAYFEAQVRCTYSEDQPHEVASEWASQGLCPRAWSGVSPTPGLRQGLQRDIWGAEPNLQANLHPDYVVSKGWGGPASSPRRWLRVWVRAAGRAVWPSLSSVPGPRSRCCTRHVKRLSAVVLCQGAVPSPGPATMRTD